MYICFIKDNTIFYFETKINLNLDSEKLKVTDDKISIITKLYSIYKIIFISILFIFNFNNKIGISGTDKAP